MSHLATHKHKESSYLRAYKVPVNRPRSSTTVEFPLQISSFLTNKANLPDDQMNVNMVLSKNYEDKTLGERGKNKPNSNPIQTQSNPIQSQLKPKQTQYKPKQTQPVVSLPALSLPVLPALSAAEGSIVEGSKGSNLFQRQKNAHILIFASPLRPIFYAQKKDNLL